jgi:hypothetical protein
VGSIHMGVYRCVVGSQGRHAGAEVTAPVDLFGSTTGALNTKQRYVLMGCHRCNRIKN